MNHLITAMIATGLIFTHLPSAFSGVPLGAAQLKRLVPGRYKVTLLGVSNVTVTLRSNGTIFGAAQGAIDKGHWKFTGNEICIAWNKWLGGRDRCSELVSQAGYYQGNGFTLTPL